MTQVDPDFAEWLGREEVLAKASDGTADAKWGALAIDTSISSPLAFKDDADDEAARQLAFRPGPIDVDVLRIPGQRVDLIGSVVTLTARKAGYEAGIDVFVLDADETDADGGTRLTVLRRK